MKLSLIVILLIILAAVILIGFIAFKILTNMKMGSGPPEMAASEPDDMMEEPPEIEAPTTGEMMDSRPKMVEEPSHEIPDRPRASMEPKASASAPESVDTVGMEVEEIAMSVEEGSFEEGTEDTLLADEDYNIVVVYYGTDRNLTGSKKPDKVFGTDHAQLSYGRCEVSIPKDHRIGELEAPSIFRFEFTENPEKHVVLLKTDVLPYDQFIKRINDTLGVSSDKDAFVFVHGFSVTFEDAARRTAQISYDLEFKGAPLFYSWPSKGKKSKYTVDEKTIELSKEYLKRFLISFFKDTDAQNVYLIAHSMGNRALTGALTDLLNDHPDYASRLKEIILTAPDIDAQLFKEVIGPALTKSGRPVTLYASSTDVALSASKKVHGAARLGDSSDGILILPGIESIDATSVDTSLIGHSYYGDEGSVLSDLYYLVQKGLRADNRFGLTEVSSDEGLYWKFKG